MIDIKTHFYMYSQNICVARMSWIIDKVQQKACVKMCKNINISDCLIFTAQKLQAVLINYSQTDQLNFIIRKN